MGQPAASFFFFIVLLCGLFDTVFVLAIVGTWWWF